MYESIDNNVNYLVENLLNQLIVMIFIINICGLSTGHVSLLITNIMDIIDHLLFHLNLNILIESNRSKCPHHYDYCYVEA